MQPYQLQYIENMREIRSLGDFYSVPTDSFPAWYAAQKARQARIAALKQQNIDLLNRHLFPLLDELHAATDGEIAELEAFGDKLMDWSTNLDCGVYVLIHEALLSLYRFRRERNGIIKELYKLGMGLYYQNHIVQAIDKQRVASFRFRNEMIFTEGGSYLKFFADIDDPETRGYIIRSLANIAICTIDRKRRIAVSAKTLEIVKDDYYRSLAPDLPWDAFLRRTNQQMSANRTTLSRGDLTTAELAAVLESCYEVFAPEADNPNPNVRWLWPYYEMEYSCGFVDLGTTLERLERLIRQAPEGEYDMSSLYANVQLPLYYGILLRNNPQLLEDHARTRFLAYAYARMLQTLLTCPTDRFDDYFYYLICYVITDYFETDGVPPYATILRELMQRFSGAQYIRSEQAADLLRLYCDTILAADATFFDDIPHIGAIGDAAQKREALLAFAEQCGRYYDLGRMKMNIDPIEQARSLFESEFQMSKLHTASGHDDLIRRRSTEIYADVALGHHAWYNGAGGYPDDYVRNDSPYRQMTDVVAVVAFLLDAPTESIPEAIREALALERKRFNPQVTAFLSDKALRSGIEAILSDDAPYYRRMFEHLNGTSR